MNTTKLKHLKNILTNPRHFLFPRNIFLFSHMRARTSLMGHILGSHPDIEGYFEMHMSYDNAHSLTQQRLKFLSQHKAKKHSRFFFDKLLHNYLSVDQALLQSENIKCIFALRPPESTIPSITSLFAKKDESHKYANMENAIEYYIGRLEKMVETSKTIPNNYLYLDADAITQSPTESLAKLGNWLSLSTPLLPEYDTFSRTGKAGAGDSSENIKAGKVIQTDEAPIAPSQPPDILKDAIEVYTRCRRALIEGAMERITVEENKA